MVEYRIDVVVDPSGAVSGSRTVERELVRVENRADRVRAGLGRAFAFLGGAALLGSSIRTLAEFDQAMSTVAAISGATGEEFAALTDKALALGAATRFTAVQAAGALGELTRAGFTATESLAAVGDTLLLAQAGGLGLAEATDIASNAIRAFRLSADQAGRVADVLSKAANSSNSSVQELGEGLKFAAPIAATLGVTLEQTAAAMGVLSDSGLKASLAGTGLRQIFAGLLNPSKEAVEIFSRLGLTTADLNVQQRGLIPVLQTLRDSGFDVADALKTFGDRGGPAFEILKAGLPKVISLTEALDNSAGSARKTADIMDDNLNGALLRVRSAFEALVLAVGSGGGTSGLRSLFESLASGLRFLAANADSLINFIQNLALFLGPRYLLGAIRAIGVAIAANPLGLLLTVIAAIVAVIPDFQTKLEGLIGTIAELAGSLTSGLDFTTLFSGLASAIDGVLALFSGLGAAIGTLFDNLGTQPEVVGELILKGFRDAAEAVLDIYLALFQTLGNLLGFFGRQVVDVAGQSVIALRELALGNLEGAQEAADAITANLKGSLKVLTEIPQQFSQNLKKLRDVELLPEVELSNQAFDLGTQVSTAFKQAVEDSAPTAQEALDRLLGRPEELAAAAAERAAALTKDLKPAPVIDEVAKPAALSTRAQEILGIIDVTRVLREEEIALNEILAQRPDLSRAIQDAMLAAQIAALDTSTALEDGFTRAFLKLQQEAQDLASVAEGVVNAFADRATDAIVEFARTGEFSFKKFASAVLEDITRILVRLLVVQAISAALGGGGAGLVNTGATALGGGGGRARGGTVQPDRSYVVGENGPELFQPNQTGTIVPNSQPAAPPQVNVQVVNVDDPNKVPQAISNGDADEAIINALARNKDRVSQVIR